MFGIASNKPLVLVGGPPCQGFSSHKKKDKRKDNRNSLVARNVELGIESGSDVIILANVSDLFANKHWELYSEAEAMLEEDGDIITSSVLSLAEYGVPQERFRAVVVASKKKTNSAAQ